MTRFVPSLLAFALISGCAPEEVADVDLVPAPMGMETLSGAFVLEADARIAVSEGAEAVGELLALVLRPSTGWELPVVQAAGRRGDVVLVLDAGVGMGEEGYVLYVDESGVAIRAEAAAGLFYGCQTLRQLLPPEVERRSAAAGVEWAIQHVEIADRPRFAWRGTMLDVARHFFDKAEVERQIELAAYHKLNRFHLHLTDDQGWRIEIQSWPDLTATGGSTQVGGGPGGFFSQADFAEIVAFAEARFVVVVPEIDVPGHVGAALASYGVLNEDGQPADLYTGTQVGFSSLWLEGEATLPFVRDVLAEMAAISPGPWLHVGGDEADATDDDEYAAFMREVAAIVAEQGRTMIAWEEAGRAGLAPPWVAQAWRMQDGADLAAAGGAWVVASRATRAYLDMMYDADSPVGTMWAGFTSVQDAYEWDPGDDFAEEQLLGLEAPLWTETVATRADLDFLVWPRLAGHADIAWSRASGRSWSEYRSRLAWHGRRLEELGVGFYRAPDVDWR